MYGTEEMKKILFITHDDMSGGSSRSLLDQILYLKEMNMVDPIVVTWGENSLTHILIKKKVQVIAAKYDFTSVWTKNSLFHFIKRPYYRFFYNFFAYRKLKREIDFSNISLIVSNSSVIDFGAYLYRQTHIPHVWYLREFGDIDFNIKSYVKNLPLYIDQNTSAVITVSKAVATHWKRRGLLKEPIVIYNGVKCTDCANANKPVCVNVNICMCGRFSPAKGQVTAIEAMSKLPLNLRNKINLDFWGVGESEQKMRTMIAQYKLEDCVKIRGFSNSLDQELSNYDIGLNLSKAEAFGRTTVEYMSHGLFVICCNSGGSPELVANNPCAKMIDVDSSDQLVEALKDYLSKVNYYKSVAAQSSMLAKQQFAIYVNAESALGVYKKYWL